MILKVKLWILFLCLMILFSVVLTSCKSKDEKLWDETRKVNTIEKYRLFIESYPESSLVKEAKFSIKLIDHLRNYGSSDNSLVYTTARLIEMNNASYVLTLLEGPIDISGLVIPAGTILNASANIPAITSELKDQSDVRIYFLKNGFGPQVVAIRSKSAEILIDTVKSSIYN